MKKLFENVGQNRFKIAEVNGSYESDFAQIKNTIKNAEKGDDIEATSVIEKMIVDFAHKHNVYSQNDILRLVGQLFANTTFDTKEWQKALLGKIEPDHSSGNPVGEPVSGKDYLGSN